MEIRRIVERPCSRNNVLHFLRRCCARISREPLGLGFKFRPGERILRISFRGCNPGFKAPPVVGCHLYAATPPLAGGTVNFWI